MKKWLVWLGALGAAGMLSGCSLVSNPALLQQSVVTRTVDPTGLASVMSALSVMKPVDSYELKASVAVQTGRFTQQVNYYGSVRLPSTVSMDMTIGGANYVIYQDGSLAYYMDGNDGNRWLPMQPVGALQPWNSLLKLLRQAPPKVVYQLPQQVVVSWPCRVYQFETIAKPVSLPGGIAAIGSSKQTIPHAALYTLYVDTTDGRLRQVQVQSTVGVPGLGTSSITSTELYFSKNAKLSLPVPTALVSQLEKPLG